LIIFTCSDQQSWEPEENLDCPDLIAAFEEGNKPVETPRSKTPTTPMDDSPAPAQIPDTPIIKGFEDNLKPERVVAATDVRGEMNFMIKW
jgi:hypothetical protein